MDNFKALWVSENADKTFERHIITRSINDLPPHEVLIKVAFSSLNYKDGLSASGNKGVTRQYPHTPGIDAAGVVVSDSSGRWAEGQEVIVTGFDLGMNTAGGYGQFIRVPAAWVVALPEGLSLAESMAIGTAGLTAGLCIDKLLRNGLTPEKGAVLVTGATGGVGSVAVAILAQLGFEVVAVSGKPEATDWLKGLGAASVVDRAAVDDASGRPLLKPLYAAAVDTVGGSILASVLKTIHYDGAVACCGLVQSPQLPTSVLPFILRGVTLFGIDSVECALEWRQAVWTRLAQDWKPKMLATMTETHRLEDLEPKIQAILKGQSKGRIVVDLW